MLWFCEFMLTFFQIIGALGIFAVICGVIPLMGILFREEAEIAAKKRRGRHNYKNGGLDRKVVLALVQKRRDIHAGIRTHRMIESHA